ncbi:MAG: lipase family protein [Jatrophihabitans sp.]
MTSAAACLALAVSGAAAVAQSPAGAATAPLPQNDPFYRPTPGFAATPVGTILRSRPVQLAAFAVLPQNVQAWQVLYRSTDYRGQPMASVTTLLKPAGAAPKAVISYQVAEDAAAPQCAPSYTMRPGAAPGEIVNQAELLLIDAAVGQGFAVSVPDYEGFRGDFGAARQPGYAILDGLRAAEHFGPLALPAGNRTPAAVWGYSGGSLASGWAAQVQPSYAPDLNIRGIALGGFVTDLAAALIKINGGFGSGLIASALPGVDRSSPPLAAALAKYLTPAGKAALAKAGTQCEISNLVSYPFTDFSKYLTVPLKTFLTLPTVRAGVAELDLGGSAPAAPLYVYHAVNDELVPIAGTDATVKKYCAAGDSVRYERDLLSEHGSLAVTGAPAALAWLTDRLTGHAAASGCHTSTVLSTALTPGGLTQFPNTVRSILLGLLDLPIGPGTIF